MRSNYILYIALKFFVLSSVAMNRPLKNDPEITSFIRQGIISSKTAFVCIIANRTGRSLSYTFGSKVKIPFDSEGLQESLENGVDKTFNFEATTYLILQLSKQGHTQEYLIVRTNECEKPVDNRNYLVLKKFFTHVDLAKLMPYLESLQRVEKTLTKNGYGLKVACDYEKNKEDIARYKAGALASAIIILGTQGEIQANVTFKQ